MNEITRFLTAIEQGDPEADGGSGLSRFDAWLKDYDNFGDAEPPMVSPKLLVM